MIVIEESDGSLLLVRQPDHAIACARIARAWHRPKMLAGEMWSRLIAAVRRHDDGWIVAEKRLMLDEASRPFDFKSIPTATHAAVWRRSVDLGEGDPYVALLIAQHARWLYTTFAKGKIDQQRIAQELCTDLVMRIDGLLEQLSAGSPREQAAVEPHALEASRALLSFFDALSLVLIGSLPPISKSESVAYADQNTSLTIELRNGTVHVHPWPFEADQWRLETTAMRLTQSAFADSEDLARHIAVNAPTQLAWTLQPR